ncbi:hypothetical protein QR680_011606 [Steinernema hermaphroditum]|uniref:Uncharacterized protein n=1 Tax=Steinernema hermaphroditum TaxID=289476 RepID=A0AA39LYZ9_9BILA|nr:hypothetical protein QR680_011606 [Steinernema hermaphroditum]
MKFYCGILLVLLIISACAFADPEEPHDDFDHLRAKRQWGWGMRRMWGGYGMGMGWPMMGMGGWGWGR